MGESNDENIVKAFAEVVLDQNVANLGDLGSTKKYLPSKDEIASEFFMLMTQLINPIDSEPSLASTTSDTVASKGGEKKTRKNKRKHSKKRRKSKRKTKKNNKRKSKKRNYRSKGGAGEKRERKGKDRLGAEGDSRGTPAQTPEEQQEKAKPSINPLARVMSGEIRDQVGKSCYAHALTKVVHYWELLRYGSYITVDTGLVDPGELCIREVQRQRGSMGSKILDAALTLQAENLKWLDWFITILNTHYHMKNKTRQEFFRARRKPNENMPQISLLNENWTGIYLTYEQTIELLRLKKSIGGSNIPPILMYYSSVNLQGKTLLGANNNAHAVILMDYNEETRQITIWNSWGDNEYFVKQPETEDTLPELIGERRQLEYPLDYSMRLPPYPIVCMVLWPISFQLENRSYRPFADPDIFNQVMKILRKGQEDNAKIEAELLADRAHIEGSDELFPDYLFERKVRERWDTLTETIQGRMDMEDNQWKEDSSPQYHGNVTDARRQQTHLAAQYYDQQAAAFQQAAQKAVQECEELCQEQQKKGQFTMEPYPDGGLPVDLADLTPEKRAQLRALADSAAPMEIDMSAADMDIDDAADSGNDSDVSMSSVGEPDKKPSADDYQQYNGGRNKRKSKRRRTNRRKNQKGKKSRKSRK